MMKFSNIENEYLLFLQCTNEKEMAAKTIFKHFEHKKTRSSLKRLLDVGSASGEITNRLIQLMDNKENLNVTLIEPNSYLLKIARNQLEHSGIRSLVCIQKKIEETKEFEDYLPGFDLIIASHLLNYVIDIPNTLQQLYSAVALDGQLCISLSMPTCDIFKIRSIYLDYVDRKEELGIHSEELFRYIEDFGWEYDTKEVTSLVKFLLSDVKSLTGITRFIGHSSVSTIPPDLFDEISKIYLKHSKSGVVYLKSKDRFIWINKTPQS